MIPRHVLSRYDLEALEQRRLLSAGDLDAGFGVDGRFAETLASMTLVGGQMLVLRDDRLLTELHGPNEEGAGEPGRYELRRYTAGGAPDVTFGDAGAVVGSLPPECNSLAGRLLEMPDGKIVALAVSGFDEFLVRFNPDGTLDTTFDGDVLRPLPDPERFADFNVGPGGTLYVATEDHGIGYVYRFLPDGTPDTTFGNRGAATFTGGVRVMNVAPDGKVLVGGSAALLDDRSVAAVSRLNADGSLDTGFGDGGTVVLPALGLPSNTVFGLAVLPDGQTLVLTRMAAQRPGGEVTGLAVLRLGDDGATDESFSGGDGVAFLEGAGSPVAIEADAQGRALVVGTDGSARLLADGVLDPAFGRVAIEIPWTRAAGAGLQSGGRLIVGLHRELYVPRVNGFRFVGRGIVTYGIHTDDPAPSPIALDGDVLGISGTAGDDVIDVVERGATLRAVREGFGRAFDLADVDRISVTGGAGDDRIWLKVQSVPGEAYGGDGRDRIAGGDGHDTLYGQGGRDFIDGGNGADLIVGGGGNEQIRGQGGADHLYGYGGDDVIEGSIGNDWIVGGNGRDTLRGGAGDDWFIANDGAIDELSGDGGTDSADADEDDLLASIETTA